jgi:hypothetical protein
MSICVKVESLCREGASECCECPSVVGWCEQLLKGAGSSWCGGATCDVPSTCTLLSNGCDVSSYGCAFLSLFRLFGFSSRRRGTCVVGLEVALCPEPLSLSMEVSLSIRDVASGTSACWHRRRVEWLHGRSSDFERLNWGEVESNCREGSSECGECPSVVGCCE